MQQYRAVARSGLPALGDGRARARARDFLCARGASRKLISESLPTSNTRSLPGLSNVATESPYQEGTDDRKSTAPPQEEAKATDITGIVTDEEKHISEKGREPAIDKCRDSYRRESQKPPHEAEFIPFADMGEPNCSATVWTSSTRVSHCNIIDATFEHETACGHLRVTCMGMSRVPSLG